MVVFSMFKKNARPAWTIDSPSLHEHFLDFILSRQAKNCSPATLEFYRYTAGVFLVWCEKQGVTAPDQIKSRHVRRYIADLSSGGKKDNTCHDHARAIRTLLRFWLKDQIISEPVEFDMPKVAKERLPVLTVDQLQTVLRVCNVRNRSIILVMVDSGVRKMEAINLNWGDLDMSTGLLRIRLGKGKKDRSTVIGAVARRALLKYRRQLHLTSPGDPMFQTQTGERFTGDGFIQIFHRLTTRTGIYVSPHALRRTFAILSLRNGMDSLHLQALGGWTSLDMVNRYAQMVDDDILQAHKSYSPVDNLDK
jgi:integrase/recombinase XerD